MKSSRKLYLTILYQIDNIFRNFSYIDIPNSDFTLHVDIFQAGIRSSAPPLKPLPMKYFTYLCLFLALSLYTSSTARDVSFFLANAQVTSDGTDNFYEADVMATSETGFRLGSGQLYFNYNPAAFGPNIHAGGGLSISFPEDAVLATKAFGAFDFYEYFVINDNTRSRVSFSWQQAGFSSGCLEGDNIGPAPTLLFHIKAKFAPARAPQAPGFCIESSPPFNGQTFEACGPADSRSTKNCDAAPSRQVADDHFDCSPLKSWYADADGDGFGGTQGFVLATEQPAGYIADGSDCNDANPAIKPTALETCDGVDNDCDGIVDGVNLFVNQLSGYLAGLDINAGIKQDLAQKLEKAGQEYCSGGGASRMLQALEEIQHEVGYQKGGGIPADKAGYVAARLQTLAGALRKGDVPCCPGNGQSPPANPGKQSAAGYSLELSPNPFSGKANVSFFLPETAQAELQVINPQGQLVRTLASGLMDAGSHQLEWDAAMGKGGPLDAGVYLLRLSAEETVLTVKATLVR